MIIKVLWFVIWFIAGFLTVGAIRLIKEKREIANAMAEQMMLHYALSEKTPMEISELCTKFGSVRATEMIINEYKLKHKIY